MPEATPKHVLFSVAGATPAIITETLYGLQTQGVIGGEIHLLTTTKGLANLGVLLGPDGQVAAFNRAYGASWELRPDWVETVFPRPLPGRRASTPRAALDDLRTSEDNAAAADAILERVRRYTADPEVILHASVAGGRKTMGLFLAQAMSWYARSEDDLSHVLVEPEYENRALNFFFPDPRKPEQAGLVDYAPLQFVRMRAAMPDLLEGPRNSPLSYTEMVHRSRLYLEDTLYRRGRLELARGPRKFTLALTLDALHPSPLDQITIPLQPLSAGLYLFLFEHANEARGQTSFHFRDAFRWRDALAACLELTAPDEQRNETNSGLSALQYRVDPERWPPAWAQEYDAILGQHAAQTKSMKKVACEDARAKQLTDAFGKLTSDFKSLPWKNASFAVIKSGHDKDGEGASRHVNIDPQRLRTSL